MPLSFFLQPLLALRRLYRRITTQYLVQLMGSPVPIGGQHVMEHFLVAEYLHSRFERCRLTTLCSIRLCKRHYAPFHEFVVLELHHDEQRRTVGFLDMERCMDNTPLSESSDTHQPPVEGIQQSPVAETHPNTSTPPSVLRSSLPALDRAVIINGSTLTRVKGKGLGAFDELICVPLLNYNIPLGNVIAAWKVISEYKEEHTPLKHQCFWFALLLFRLLIGRDLWDQHEATLFTKGQSSHKRMAGTIGLFGTVSRNAIEADAARMEANYLSQAEISRNPRPYVEIGTQLVECWVITEGTVSARMRGEVHKLEDAMATAEAEIRKAIAEKEQAIADREQAIANREQAIAEWQQQIAEMQANQQSFAHAN